MKQASCVVVYLALILIKQPDISTRGKGEKKKNGKEKRGAVVANSKRRYVRTFGQAIFVAWSMYASAACQRAHRRGLPANH